jgi:hypothetical protein
MFPSWMPAFWKSSPVFGRNRRNGAVREGRGFGKPSLNQKKKTIGEMIFFWWAAEESNLCRAEYG